MYIFISIHQYTYLYIYHLMQMCIYIYMFIQNYIHTHTCGCMYIHVYIHIYEYMYQHRFLYLFVYIYICMYTSFCPFCGIKSKSQTEKTTDTSNLGARTNDNMLCKRIRHGSKLYSASFPFPFPCKTSPFPPAFPLVHLL